MQRSWRRRLDADHLSHHTCFTDALEFIERHIKRDPTLVHDKTFVLVHGILVVPEGEPNAGLRHSHAWVEKDGDVWQSGFLDGQKIYFACRRDEFYAEAGIEASTSYTMLDVWIANKSSGHFGPWKPDYQALCREVTDDRQDHAERERHAAGKAR